MPQGESRLGSAEPEADDELSSGAPDRRRLPPWLVKGAGALAVVVAGVVAAPRLLSSDADPTPHPQPAARTSPAVTVPANPAPTLPAELRWPTRGDLASDAGFLDQAQDVAASIGGLTTVHEVLFAGRVGDARVALVAGLTADAAEQLDAGAQTDEQVVDVVVPAEGSGPRSESVGGMPVGGSPPVAVVPVAGHALLLGPPGRRSWELSAAVTFTPDGRAHRTWRSVSAPDGWTVVPVPSTPPPSLGVRNIQGGEMVVQLDPSLVPPAADPTVAGLGGRGYAGPAADPVRQAVAGQLLEPGFVGWRFTSRVVWSGLAGASGDVPAAVVVLRRSDGATFQLAVAQADDGLISSPAASIPWARPERRPADLRTMLGDVIVLPGRHGRLEWRSGDRHGSVPISAAGVALVPVDPGDGVPVTLVVHDATGSHRLPDDVLEQVSPLGF